MEFDIELLRRDWIEGISGEVLHARVEARCAGLGAGPLLIRTTEPIDFAVEFFAGLFGGQSIVLPNPNWAAQEIDEFETLMALETPEPGAILIPTGGTTGGVKLAIHDWASLSAAARATQGFLGGGPIHSACVLPLYHVSGLMQLIRSFVSGGTIRFHQDAVDGRCLSLVPTQLQRALQDDISIQNLNTASAIFVGGAPMPEGLAQEARRLRLPVVPVYGMTETAAMIAAIPNADFLSNPSAGAVPLGDAQFSIEQNGRIRIRGSALFRGYQGRSEPELSDGYVADDLGRIDGNGRLHVDGRADRLIITGGEKVDPGEVEAALLEIEGVEETLVVGEADEDWGQAVVAFYTGNRLIDQAVCKLRLSGILAPHKIPKKLIQVDAIPAKLQNVGASLAALGQDGSRFGNVARYPAGASLAAPAGDVKDPARENVGASLAAPAEDVKDQTAGVPRNAPTRETGRLYLGRVSIPQARYFVTLCLKDREQSLLTKAVANAILGVWKHQEVEKDYILECGTLMPDHIHLLLTLGERLSLGQCISKFKAKTKEALAIEGLKWQRDFYDHRLRTDDSMEGFARYIYLNPYRKSLLRCEEPWPYWNLSDGYRPEFFSHLNAAGGPPQEWLTEADVLTEDLIEKDLKP